MLEAEHRKNLERVFEVFYVSVFNEVFPLEGIELDEATNKAARAYFDFRTKNLVDFAIEHELGSVLPELLKEATELTFGRKYYAGDKLKFIENYIDEILNYCRWRIEEMFWLLQSLIYSPEDLNDGSGYNNIDRLETLINAVTLAQTLEFKDRIHKANLNNVVLGRVKEVLFEIKSAASNTKLSDLTLINKKPYKSGAPNKSSEFYQRNTFIKALLDDGYSETKAFKKASEAFCVSTDSLRKPFKIWQKKNAKLQEAIAKIKPIHER